jgi:hypothetical protein
MNSSLKRRQFIKTVSMAGASMGLTQPMSANKLLFGNDTQEIPWTWSGSPLVKDYDSYSLKLIDKNMIRVHVSFAKNDNVKWEINMNEFPG